MILNEVIRGGMWSYRISVLIRKDISALTIWEFRHCRKVMWGLGFPDGSDGKESVCIAGDPGSIPGLGRSLGEGNGNPLQYSFLENSMDGGAWWAADHRVAESDMTELLYYTSLWGFSWKAPSIYKPERQP